MISLIPLAKDQQDRVAHIAVLPEQVAFCGRIAEHFAANEDGVDFHAILRDDLVVGFFKLDRSYPQRYDFARADEIGVRGVMIDASQQGKGTGKAAMRMLRPYVAAQYPHAQGLILTVNIANPAARAVYLAAGFEDEGALYHGGQNGPQHILRLSLPQL